MPVEPPVLDSSAISRLVLQEEGWEAVDEIVGRAEDHDLVPRSLEFAKLETANSIWKQLTLLKRIDLAKAMLFVESLECHPFDYVKADEVILKEAVRIGQKHRLTVYDAAFIALAARDGSRLVTIDGEQAAIAKKYVSTVLV